MFKKLLSFTKGYRIISILTPIIVFIDAYIEIKLPSIMAKVINTINNLNGTGSREEVNKRLLEMLGYCLLTLVIGYIAARFSAIASMGFSANMRSALFNKVQDLSFENIDKLKISSLITRMTSDVSMVQSMYSSILVTFVKGPYLMILALVKAITISSMLSQVFYVAVPSILIALVVLGILIVPLFKKMLESTDNFNQTIRSNIVNMRVVKAFVREEHEKEQFEDVNTTLAKMNVKAQRMTLYLSPILMLIIYACMVLTLYRGSKIILFEGESVLTLGDLSAFVTYISQVISSLMTVLIAFLTIVMARASINRIGEVFGAEPTVKEDEAQADLLPEDGSIEFKNVSFKYNLEAEKKILDDISFKINAGETIGIIGATGSAKSTIVQLIPRLYEATEGEVIVGGHNVKKYLFKNLREEISFVMQHNVLFKGTIKDNIRWGNMDATDEEIEQAAKYAQAHDFIMEKEHGYDEEVGQGGNTVSGGQRQRICIARALLKRPKILILDDSTSAVDTATDSKIKAALRLDEFKDITKIIIAQRISSIMDADRILVIDDGKLNGFGTHEELRKNNEIYNDIYISQMEGVLTQ